MQKQISLFIGRFKSLKRWKKIFIAILLLVAIIVGRILIAQFGYTEIGYKPVETDEEFRMALSVSPFTATNFKNGYTYEYEDRQITNIEELEQLYIDKIQMQTCIPLIRPWNYVGLQQNLIFQ